MPREFRNFINKSMPSSKPSPAPLSNRYAWPFRKGLAATGPSNNGPRVSVIIPSYNQADFLEAAIRSVLMQDYPNVECLVLDAGSQDGSQKIIEHYQSNLAYARSEPDNGQSAAVNEGARQATGGIMSFLNSDDMLTPGAITKVVQAFDQHPETMLVHGHRILINAQDEVAGWTSSPPFDADQTLYTINSETAFWRQPVFEELGGFNESLRFALDLDFFCRIYVRHPIYLLDEFLGLYRFHPDSKSETLSDVCRKESDAQWQAIFGKPFPQRKPTPPSIMRKFSHFTRALKAPGLVFAPYVKAKLAQALRSKAKS